jgi:hypothetical protein
MMDDILLRVELRGCFRRISYYRLGKFEEALTIFQRTLVLAKPIRKSKGLPLAGKTFTALENRRCENFGMAETADPTDYYSIRAGELIKGRRPY